MILNIVTKSYGEKESKIAAKMFIVLVTLTLSLPVPNLKEEEKGFTRLEIYIFITLQQPSETFKNQLWWIFFYTNEGDKFYKLFLYCF